MSYVPQQHRVSLLLLTCVGFWLEQTRASCGTETSPPSGTQPSACRPMPWAIWANWSTWPWTATRPTSAPVRSTSSECFLGSSLKGYFTNYQPAVIHCNISPLYSLSRPWPEHSRCLYCENLFWWCKICHITSLEDFHSKESSKVQAREDWEKKKHFHSIILSSIPFSLKSEARFWF